MRASRTEYWRKRRATHRATCKRLKLCVDCGRPAKIDKKFDPKTGKLAKKVVRLRCAACLEENSRAHRG